MSKHEIDEPGSGRAADRQADLELTRTNTAGEPEHIFIEIKLRHQRANSHEPEVRFMKIAGSGSFTASPASFSASGIVSSSGKAEGKASCSASSATPVSWSAQLPSRASVAGKILIFVCKPDDAEVIVGDLLEDFEKVLARHGHRTAGMWFVWELILVVLSKVRSRLARFIIPASILEAILKRLGS